MMDLSKAGERIEQIKKRIAKAYVFDEAGSVVVAMENDLVWAIEVIDQLEEKLEALARFDGSDPIPILRICAKTLENSNKWSNALAKQVASEIRLERANWLRRFATHLKSMRE